MPEETQMDSAAGQTEASQAGMASIAPHGKKVLEVEEFIFKELLRNLRGRRGMYEQLYDMVSIASSPATATLLKGKADSLYVKVKKREVLRQARASRGS